VRRALVVAAGVAVLAGTGCATGFTGPPGTIGPNSANVSGSFATNVGGTVETWVEYGPTKAYGSATQHSIHQLDPGNFQGQAGGQLTGLQRDTVYHYRVCASDSDQQGGPGCGEDRHFKTQPIGCGETLTTDVRLTGDFSCGADPALRIGADGVDLNLGGHKMVGFVSPKGESNPGIVNDGYDDFILRNGQASGYTTAFTATDANRNLVRYVQLEGLGFGADFQGGADNAVRHSDVVGAVYGAVHSHDSARLVVADSKLEAFFTNGGAWIESNDARIVRNRFVTEIGLDHRVPALKVTGNRAHIAENIVSGSWLAGGFVLSGSDNVVVSNNLTGGTGDGIFVSPFSANLTLRGNLVDGWSDDGIDVQAASTRLESNSATNNGDWGIDAVPGVTDQGGNTASGNGQAAQCRNVICG
jgi:hypothetical protein